MAAKVVYPDFTGSARGLRTYSADSQPGGGDAGGPGGGDGMTSIFRTDAVRDVPYLKAGIAVLATCLFAVCAFFLVRIDDRFDRADDGVKKVAEKVEDLRISDAEQRSDIKAILEKVSERNNTPQPSTEGK